MVSGSGAAGGSRRERPNGFSFGRARAVGCTVGVVAGAAGLLTTGACPNGRCSARVDFVADSCVRLQLLRSFG